MPSGRYPSMPFLASRLAAMACSSYGSDDILGAGRWMVEFAPEFDLEFPTFPPEMQNRLLSRARVLSQLGPALGRPYVDTLAGSKHPNLKELRFRAAGGVWRVVFAFDPRRRAILLVAGNKAGASGKRFYEHLIRLADERFDALLIRIQLNRR